MHLDWTISVWQVGVACWITFLFFFSVIRRIDRLILIFQEYPPHRHVDETIIYPKGIVPAGD